MANTTKPIIDANALEAMAKERPNDKFLKGSGVLKLIQAIRDLERANRQLQAEQPIQIKNLRKALQFYADGHHFIRSDGDAWDTVSGEPQNYWCDEAGTATVEDGSIAKLALAGHPIKFENEDATAQPAAPQGVAYAELEKKHRDFVETVGLMLDAIGYKEDYACQWPKEKASVTFKRWFDEQLASHGQAPAGATSEPIAYLYDDGSWTPAKTEEGRKLNDWMISAGSPKIGVHLDSTALAQLGFGGHSVTAPAGWGVAVPVVGYRISDPDEPDLGHWLSEEPGAAWCVSEPLALATPAQAAQAGSVSRPCHVFTVRKTGSLTEWEPTTMAFALPDGAHALYTLPQPTTTAQAAPAAGYDHGPQSTTVEEAARHVGKWLNERPNRPLDLRDVAMLVAHVQAPAAGAVAGPWKDHKTREIVNQLRDCAKEFHATQQLRERLLDVLGPMIDWVRAVQAPTPAAQARRVLEDAASGMAAEYQRWIDFFHKGNGDYNDFLRIELNHDAAHKQGGA